jgi:hypothetical protein
MAKMKIREFLPLLFGLAVIGLTVAVAPEAVKYLSKASMAPANIVVNYEGVIGQMPKPWRNLAQGGEEAKAMLGGVTDEIKQLKPEYIRIDHIYDAFQVVSRDGSGLLYDWTGLDNAVSEILSTGAKPVLSLSYMPSAISRGDIIDLPRDMNEWGDVVRATVEHYSGRNNKNINGVIYEVWNEPDLFGKFKTYGDKNYLDLYAAAVRGAVRASNVNSFEIGGPATTALYENWVANMIKFVDKNNLRMDFLSWHRYSTDIEQFETDVKQAREYAEKIPALANLKYYVTEWGHNSENDSGYDNTFGAIHTLAVSRVMMGRIDRGFVFEIKDGPGNEKYWGRWGILTHEKFGNPEKKPRFRALEFLNSLYSFRMSLSGEGGYVKGVASVNEIGSVRVLLVNYDRNGKHSEAVPVSFENLPNGNFTYSRRDFNGGTKSIKVATTSASWKTTEFFGPNSAAFLDLTF